MLTSIEWTWSILYVQNQWFNLIILCSLLIKFWSWNIPKKFFNYLNLSMKIKNLLWSNDNDKKLQENNSLLTHLFKVLRIKHWVCGQRIRCDNYNFSIFVKSKTMLVIPNETVFQTLKQNTKTKKQKKKKYYSY